MSATPRVLLIAPYSSYRTAPFIAAAERLGVPLLIASQSELPVSTIAVQGVNVSFANADEAFAKLMGEAERAPFLAVLGTDDATTELAARIAAELGLPHNPPEAVRLARRKDLARQRLAVARVRVPCHWRVDLRNPLAAQVEAVTYPCVLKPVALSASRGVIRANTRSELFVAAARIERITRAELDGEERHLLLVEEYIPGIEVALEGMLSSGELEVLAVFDKPDPLEGPFFEETYYITPSRLDAATQKNLRATVLAACRAYGLREGPVHAECRINDAGVWVLEVAARTIGGMCARLLQRGMGVGLEELVLAQALGRSPAVPRPDDDLATGAAGVLMLPIERGGILRRVEGIAAARKVSYIEDVHIDVREGYELVPLPEGASYLGFLYSRAPTPQLAEDALRQAHACLRFVIAPLWKMDSAG